MSNTNQDKAHTNDEVMLSLLLKHPDFFVVVCLLFCQCAYSVLLHYKNLTY